MITDVTLIVPHSHIRKIRNEMTCCVDVIIGKRAV